MFATAAPLTRRPVRAVSGLPVLPDAGQEAALALGRVHELCGPARHRMALWLAAQSKDEILWIAPDWVKETLNPCGMVSCVDPARVILVQPDRTEDMLWCAEEALRAGIAPLVVVDLPELPGLTPVRRMHLAAQASGTGPLGVLLTPGMGGAQGIESRWHLAPDHQGRPGAWQLTRIRARMAPEKSWTVRHAAGHALPRMAAQAGGTQGASPLREDAHAAAKPC